MFVSDKIVYLELHKTGCTHVRNILKDLLGGEFVGKHNQASLHLFRGDRVFLGSIRNPWEWYTSLWAYGCDSRGGVHEQVTMPGIRFRGLGWKRTPVAALLTLRANLSRDPEKWKRTYEDVNDAGAFREWLHMMHDQKYWNDVREGYDVSSLSQVAGLLTYRFVKLFCTKEDESNHMDDLSTFDQLVDYEKKYCFIDRFIRNESLESDLFNALEQSGIEISSKKKSEIMSASRTNTSSRQHGPDYYYDSASARLIAEREKLLVDKFGYVAPLSPQ